ncbi:hypothetical protein BDF20DRAFT_812954, partial [Mycotypha africana]|uniref:uncharacterized protein n=1 Tax=Mycotypha africana TaxID=64632 RepID=UPI002301E732
RLGWLPGGLPQSCPRHPSYTLSRSHAITCLNMHDRLFVPTTIPDRMSFLLNMPTTSKPVVPT